MSRHDPSSEPGAARLPDISGKEAAEREASAQAVIVLSPEAFEAAVSGETAKGDVKAAARLAGILAAKKTPELIPLCHALVLAKAEIEFELLEERHAIRIVASVKATARSGVEIEALTAAAVAALTVYDMTKAIDKAATIEGVRLVSETGGKNAFAAPPIRTLRKSVPVSRGRPAVLMGEVAAPTLPRSDNKREAFRAFMTSHHLRATVWAREAGIPASQIFAYLTGQARSIPEDALKKLARAARVKVEDLFR